MSFLFSYSGWRQHLDRLALPLGLVGLIAVAVHNWRLWQRDKELSSRVQDPDPLPPLEAWPSLPLVSVLVAAWNEVDFIEQHIQSFQALRYPHKELILCAGGEDGTYELAQRYVDPRVTILEQRPGEGKQQALSRGLPQARGSVVYLTDADCSLDDEAFELTLFPVASKQEQVCTGGSRPYPELLSDPLVVAQAAADLRMYGDIHAPDYLPGLLGRNCAVERMLLVQSRGLEYPAPTGTDFVLAKILVKGGAKIRQVRQSQIMTDYPRSASDYVRQQRRWLRNVALYGMRFQSRAEVRTALLLSVFGLLMLLFPLLSLFLGAIAFSLWFTILMHGFASRLRHLRFMQRSTGLTVGWRQYWYQFASLWLDFVAWALPLIDFLSPKRRTTW